MDYFDEKEKVKKHQPHKRKAETITKKNSAKMIYEKFIEFKLKQNLRLATLNKYVVTFKNIENFNATRTDRTFYLTDVTTDFISDWVYWLKHECINEYC